MLCVLMMRSGMVCVDVKVFWFSCIEKINKFEDVCYDYPSGKPHSSSSSGDVFFGLVLDGPLI